jgi:hypothetical protein
MRTELALAMLVIGACSKDAPSITKTAPEPTRPGGARDGVARETAAPEATSPPLASKEFFRVDAASPQPTCTAGGACEARLVLTALGDYKVNDEYPFKLVADATPGIAIEGTGKFTPAGKTGTMAVAYRADKPGTAKIAGTFKLSVCNDHNCQIEAAKVAFDVAVK